MRERIFDNKLVSSLMAQYVKGKRKKRSLRDEIMTLSLPLIKAAIAKKRLYRNKADLEQDCALRILQALPKYRSNRGSAFAFLWSVICNTLITQNKKFSMKRNYSLSDDQNRREAEESSVSVDDPDRTHILNLLTKKLESVFSEESFGNIVHRKRKKIFRYIRKSVINGDLFNDRMDVIAHLKKTGLTRKESVLCIDHTMIFIRRSLYQYVKEAQHVTVPRYARKTRTHVPEVSCE